MGVGVIWNYTRIFEYEVNVCAPKSVCNSLMWWKLLSLFYFEELCVWDMPDIWTSVWFPHYSLNFSVIFLSIESVFMQMCGMELVYCSCAWNMRHVYISFTLWETTYSKVACSRSSNSNSSRQCLASPIYERPWLTIVWEAPHDQIPRAVDSIQFDWRLICVKWMNIRMK